MRTQLQVVSVAAGGSQASQGHDEWGAVKIGQDDECEGERPK